MGGLWVTLLLALLGSHLVAGQGAARAEWVQARMSVLARRSLPGACHDAHRHASMAHQPLDTIWTRHRVCVRRVQDLLLSCICWQAPGQRAGPGRELAVEEAPHTAPAQHAGRGSMSGALLQTHRCVLRAGQSSSSGRVGWVTLPGMSTASIFVACHPAHLLPRT